MRFRAVDVGGVIGEMAAAAGEELMRAVNQQFGVHIDVVLLLRQPGDDDARVMVVGVTSGGPRALREMLEGAYLRVMEAPADTHRETIIDG